ncbi:Imm1 family immunity protein [Amycolatopsis sp. NPDC059027]|uniref:Imm1 family immunity protein n=1 Tax=Amycolatopsis sp. NPDC059027 TaxID=3346709 RepID=UPI00366AF872
MVTLEVWYDQEPENDFGPGDPALVVSTPAELDELIDRILAETAEHVAPPMIQVAIAGVKRSPVLEVGLGQDKGFIGYISRTEGGATHGDGDPNTLVDYIYMSNHSQVPASTEVPMDTVRRGLREFLATGKRPSVVQTDGAS